MTLLILFLLLSPLSRSLLVCSVSPLSPPLPLCRVLCQSSMSEENSLLVFPFSTKAEFFDEACNGLKELAGFLVTGVDDSGSNPVWGPPTKPRPPCQPKLFSRLKTGAITFTKQEWKHIAPGKWLNDIIIDFFMRWWVPLVCQFSCASFTSTFVSNNSVFAVTVHEPFCTDCSQTCFVLFLCFSGFQGGTTLGRQVFCS